MHSGQVHSEHISIPNGELLYVRHFLDTTQSDRYLNLLLKSVDWNQESMHLYGKTVQFPRLTAWYGDPNTSYAFSGITLQPTAFTPALLEIKRNVETLAGVKFNSVLLNRYRNGKDSISWHADDEKELGKNPVIASLNLGATRVFQLRHNDTKEKIALELSHGSLLIMRGELQHFWKHQIPKTKKAVGERLNLTFRVIH